MRTTASGGGLSNWPVGRTDLLYSQFIRVYVLDAVSQWRMEGLTGLKDCSDCIPSVMRGRWK